MAKSNEQRRLDAILNDEDYGPALVRLPKTQQRTILDLISANDGRKARAEIKRLDEERRTKTRATRAARTVKMTPEMIHDRLVDAAYMAMVSHFGIGRMTAESAYRKSLISNLSAASDDELKKFAKFTEDEAWNYIRSQDSLRPHPTTGTKFNPLWYHTTYGA